MSGVTKLSELGIVVGNVQSGRGLTKAVGETSGWDRNFVAKILSTEANDQIVEALLLFKTETLKRIAIHVERVNSGRVSGHGEGTWTGRTVERCAESRWWRDEKLGPDAKQSQCVQSK